MQKVINYTQRIYYSSLYNQIRNCVSIRPATMAQLAPFLDHVGIICVGGRLRHVQLDDGARNSILLPQRCHLT